MGANGAFPRTKAMLAPAAIAAGVTLLAGGCQSASTNASGSTAGGAMTSGTSQPEGMSGSRVPSSKAAASLAACKTTALAMTVNGNSAGGTVGSTYYPVDFTNTGSTACTMAGYPGVSLVSAADHTGQQIGAAAQRNSQFGVAVVRLAPGGRAHAWLQVAQAGNYPESACRPETAHGLRVYPPGETEPGYVRQDVPACADSATPLLTIMPVRGGQGTARSVP